MAGVPKIVNLIMRSFQFVWILIVMSLIGNMLAETAGTSNGIINYYMFVAAFAMLSLFYLFPATIFEGAAGHAFILMAVDGLNAIFTFCAAVALPAYLHVHSCNNEYYLATNTITRRADGGFSSQRKRCREAQASTAFMWFAWAAFMGSFVLDFFQSRGTTTSVRGGIRRPQMSQA